MSEYIKGECLDTKQKFAEWVAQRKPYFAHYRKAALREFDCFDYDLWDTLPIVNGHYYQAIPKPKPKKLYAYKSIENHEILFYECPDIEDRVLERMSDYDMEFN